MQSANYRNVFKVVFCLLTFATLTFLFDYQCELNADSTPIILPAYSFYDQNHYVWVIGSWISDSENGMFSKNPINTVNLFCDETKKTCIEAVSFYNSASQKWEAGLNEYQIKKWEIPEIIAVNDNGITITEIRINTVKKTVSEIWSESVKVTGGLPLHAHIDDGSKVKPVNSSKV